MVTVRVMKYISGLWIQKRTLKFKETKVTTFYWKKIIYKFLMLQFVVTLILINFYSFILIFFR